MTRRSARENQPYLEKSRGKSAFLLRDILHERNRMMLESDCELAEYIPLGEEWH
jgi:hypothetical protein